MKVSNLLQAAFPILAYAGNPNGKEAEAQQQQANPYDYVEPPPLYEEIDTNKQNSDVFNHPISQQEITHYTSHYQKQGLTTLQANLMAAGASHPEFVKHIIKRM